jgi:hypothetical protein
MAPELGLVIGGVEYSLNLLAYFHNPLCLLHGAAQGKTVFPRHGVHPLYFSGRDIEAVHSDRAPAFAMNVEHDLRGLGYRFMENRNQYGHHELHRGKVVVKEEYPILVGLFGVLLILYEDIAAYVAEVCHYEIK